MGEIDLNTHVGLIETENRLTAVRGERGLGDWREKADALRKKPS